MTAISDGKNVTIPELLNTEQTGSHASDSIAVYRPQIYQLMISVDYVIVQLVLPLNLI